MSRFSPFLILSTTLAGIGGRAEESMSGWLFSVRWQPLGGVGNVGVIDNGDAVDSGELTVGDMIGGGAASMFAMDGPVAENSGIVLSDSADGRLPAGAML